MTLFVIAALTYILCAASVMWLALCVVLPQEARYAINAYIGWRRIRANQRSPHDR